MVFTLDRMQLSHALLSAVSGPLRRQSMFPVSAPFKLVPRTNGHSKLTIADGQEYQW